MMKRLAALPLVCAALAGCANFAPDHTHPDLAAPPAYESEYRPDGALAASQISYREWFADPRLVALLDEALTNNRDLVASTARIEQARAQYRIEDADRLPALSGTASAVRARQSVTSQTTGGETLAVPVTGNFYDAGVAVSAFEFDFWGRVANLSAAARAQYLASIAAQRAFYLSLIGDTANTYFEILETQEQIALAQATAESRKEGLRIAKLRLDAGVDSALEFRQAETLLTQAEQQLSVERLALARLRNQLAVLVGGRVPGELPNALTLAEQLGDSPIDAGLPSELLLARPDIVGAEQQLRAARANIGAARAAFFPTISLTGSAGFSSNSLDSLFSSDSLGWSFGPSIYLPIFNHGALAANLDLAKALEVEQVAAYDKTVQAAFREVSDALAGRRYLDEQVDTLSRAVGAQDRIAKIARLRYREGVADYLEVLDAERNLFSAQQDLLATRRSALQNRASLFIALGGGFPSESQPVLMTEEFEKASD